MLKYHVCQAFQDLDIQTVLKIIKIFRFIEYSLQKRNEQLCINWIRNIKRGVFLPLYRGFFKCYSHLGESCFERDLKIIILVLLSIFKLC